MGFVRNEYYYIKFIIFFKIFFLLSLNTSYKTYNINKILLSKKYYKRKL